MLVETIPLDSIVLNKLDASVFEVFSGSSDMYISVGSLCRPPIRFVVLCCHRA